MSLGLQRARAVVLAGTIIGIGVNQILWFRTLDYLAERPMLEHNSHARTISGQKLIPRPTKAFENFFSPEQELEAIFKNLNSADAKVRVTRFVESLPVDLIPSVLNKLENRRSPQIRALLYYPLLQRLAKNNVQSALGYVEALSDAHQINEGRQAILQYWARYDQKGATQWAEALPSSRQREQAFRTMVRSLAENALDEALTVCDSASAKPFSQKLRGELAKALAESNPSAAATLAARIGIRDTVVLGEIAQRWAGEDFSSALGWATNLPPAHQSAVLLALARGTEVPSNALLSYAESMRPGDRKNALL